MTVALNTITPKLSSHVQRVLVGYEHSNTLDHFISSDITTSLYVYVQVLVLVQVSNLNPFLLCLLNHRLKILKYYKKEFENTKGAIRNRISKKNKQHTG
jgi:hypothetical protein